MKMHDESRQSGSETPPRGWLSDLDEVSRVSEILFGLFMALTFTGSLSVVSEAGEVRTMWVAALGCNLAWGLVDAAMYLVRTSTERTRVAMLMAHVRASTQPEQGRALLVQVLPDRLVALAGEDWIEALRRRALAAPPLPREVVRLNGRDWLTAAGVFGLVVLATLPPVLPFVLVADATLAIRLSNLLALLMLFAGGWRLARYAGRSPWQGGFRMCVFGVLIVAAVIALGG